jgi:pimeloyl-ACP methyl ester carboxylesterase
MTMRWWVLMAAWFSVACNARRAPPPPQVMAKPMAESSAVTAEPAGPIRMEALAGAEPPMFVLRGEPRGAARMVFLHGMCGHGLGYAQSFQFSAAARGTLIAPQADVSCGGVWSKWSANLSKLDARIVETFRALGHPEPIDDIVIIGMSQGATRAVELAKKWPERYTRLISMDAPTALRPGELKSLKAAVMMAGERDRQDLMRQSERALQRSGVPVTFLLIPQATHGAMGPTPELTMGKALSFLDAPTTASASNPDLVE